MNIEVITIISFVISLLIFLAIVPPILIEFFKKKNLW